MILQPDPDQEGTADLAFKPAFDVALSAATAEMNRLDFYSLRDSAVYRDPLDYYLLATYPPIKAMSPMAAEDVYPGARGVYRVYVHIPFCEQYCTFCHYTKEINAKHDRVERYLEALFREFELVRDLVGEKIRAYSVFFGGGTPSYLSAEQLERLLERLWSILHFENKEEIIFELHPGLVRQPDYEDRIRVLKRYGVTRWVSGVQSMDEKVLRKLNRGHGRREVYDLLEVLARHDCADISLDLIYGLPYQTLENWYGSIRDLAEAGVEKFNIFPLMFKAGDPITLSYRKEPQIFPDPDQRLLMHLMAETILAEHGFQEGPILYYSKGRRRYRTLDEIEKGSHERIEGLGLIALGVSGFGYVNQVQYFNHCDMDAYITSLDHGKIPVWLGCRLSREERMRRAVMFGLRSRGLLRSDFAAKFNVDPAAEFAEEFHLLEQLGLIELGDDNIVLTKKGKIDAAGAAALFCSPEVRERVKLANQRIRDPRRDLLEIHDFSPIGHTGVSSRAFEIVK
jgi:oxygen-independent coproporphyrinogen-3 oxidase